MKRLRNNQLNHSIVFFFTLEISSLYKHPIEVPVNIPFVYCVVDKELDLVIIAGRIVNPLNSRIQ